MTEREFALDVVRKLQQAGFAALWAGGCVRDEFLGLSPDDYDVATDARPDQLRPLFKHRNEIGASFGVVQVIGPRGADGEWLTVEVATFRSDGTYTDGRRPDSVVFSSPEEDARRRDFTINGMFFDPVKAQLIDYVGGQTDLGAKVLRAIGNPAERFTEDKLRILRAVRMATRFDLAIDPETQAAATQMAAQISAVSPERIAEELRKLLTHPNRARGLRLLRDFGLVEPVLPELVPTFTLPQGLPSAPTGTLWEHTVRVVEELKGPVSFPLAFAAVLHDVGKPRTFARTPDRYTFHRHEHVGKQMAEAIADRLRLSTAEKTRIAWLVEKHQYLADAPTMRASKLKPILVHPGIRELLELHRADALATGKGLDHVTFCERMLRDTPPEELNPAPAVTGDDLIAMGLKPGREFKRLLDAVREAQLEGQIRSKADGLQFVRELRSAPPPAPGTPPPEG
ncbi:phosphohydrolase : tRNA nucleotidyltransferase/poly(A) polymerase OS=Singulisphaera acidiphila (strain ATCC BAA-1392 / DSM 18658 / VKM B-2454 / MOB10) GN=Sinac_5938 PE=3 SV=1: PolyA_pol: PolyA_pol_RNAbd: HD [Gemmataceae bacterium]|nr:phosphohydrolase : tRNA nucleotidyltransferase/poly(A) polymerase OS=Singulisphaera acidiphila (strain ATCC BAA-1392 / DSM 18658 / VKM B-2454 / MOB10) GN=Sinac_5938 PE=3 SV=1: PolyA_pol: PolyA_pol_RNAbd: HD [Gemmataceae bacterium]VTT96827.1 phosphohydrolase : tRNA nucleotidyltransferase/poly(A) polymerase OS=Singulisphaera acidiphila (strain ATCC BAA-1392 / DSM 18658 / VKM B-2454 / MOB10) GN=Sinac_5938 PE=3 SV=1: PolyA_pol: PolyA_pol_RNAbd: HD [Gemmataceae bacterium]